MESMDIDPPDQSPSHPLLPSPGRGRSNTVVGPQHNGEDYNELSAERIELLNRMDILLCHKPVPVPFWAVLVFSDLRELNIFVTESEKSPYLLEFSMHACAALGLTWRQKEPRTRLPRNGSSASDIEEKSSGASSSTSRNKSIVQKALQRDDFACVIRKTAPAQVTHIYPHCLIVAGRTKKRTNTVRTYPPFWDMLKYFWGPTRVTAWRSQIFTDHNQPETPYDNLKNLMCLGDDLHRLWNDGCFALRPIGYNTDKTTLKLEFIWQAAQGKTMDDRIPVNSLVLSSRNLTCVLDPKSKSNKERYVAARINHEVRELRTGDEIVLTTSDPVGLPLPDWHLLDMAFVLSRIVNLSGAGSIAELFEENSDDESNGYDLPVSSRVAEWLENSEMGGSEESNDEAESDISRNQASSEITSTQPSPLKTRTAIDGSQMILTEREQAIFQRDDDE
ncbi:hypothetical protein AnigIFM63604_007188 [Aspergillus niger]|uniref:HNH nuclease domain-containing protein n=1 Tax=Aspergillus niger TaxID=5061 RepID=A0A9W6A2Q6_ASPNG|nr:hypothetical protein AnigIFM63604_007188 [Aspergillus niger]